MPDRSRFAKNTVYQYGLQAAKYLFPFITLAYLTRVLGADIYAVRAYVVAAMTFMLVFLDFGTLTFGTTVIAKNEDDAASQSADTSAILVVRILLCIVGAIALAPIIHFIPLLAAYPLYTYIAYIGNCFKALLPDFVFQGKEDMGIITIRFVVTQLIGIVLIFALIHSPSDLIMIAIIETLTSALALAWSWENVFRKQNIHLVGTHVTKLTHMVREAFYFFLASAATTLYTSLTTLFIGIFISDQASISYWSIALTAIVAIQALYSPISNSIYPHMVKRADFELLTRILAIGTPVVIAIAILFAVFSNIIMLILGGEEYLPGAYVVSLVAPILVFSFPAVMLGYPVLGALGHVKELTATSAITGIFHIVVMIILAAFGMFTISSIAALRCCTEIILFATRLFFVHKYHSNELRNNLKAKRKNKDYLEGS